MDANIITGDLSKFKVSKYIITYVTEIIARVYDLQWGLSTKCLTTPLSYFPFSSMLNCVGELKILASKWRKIHGH